jgi:hypothetical protein
MDHRRYVGTPVKPNLCWRVGMSKASPSTNLHFTSPRHHHLSPSLAASPSPGRPTQPQRPNTPTQNPFIDIPSLDPLQAFRDKAAQASARRAQAINAHNAKALRARTSNGKLFLSSPSFPSSSVPSTPPTETRASDPLRGKRLGPAFLDAQSRFSKAQRIITAKKSRSPQANESSSLPLQRNEPPPCVNSCRPGSTRICPFCQTITCWICASEEAPPLCRLRPCQDCIIIDALEEEADDIEDYELAKKSVEAGAANRNYDGKARPTTRTRRVRALAAFSNWARASEGRSGILIDKAPSTILLERFVKARSNGEPLACRHGPVCEQTIQTSMTAIRKWIQTMNASCCMSLIDHTFDPAVQSALQEAKDIGPVPNKRKAPVEEEPYLAVYDKLANPAVNYPDEDQFLMNSYFIATSSIFFLLPRRSCFAKRPWDPSFLVRDMNKPSNQAVLGQDPQPWKWGIDTNRHGYVRALIGLEKNQPQQALTTRWSTDSHFLGRAVAEDLHKAFTRLNMPAGPTLRRSPRSTEPWNSTDWNAYLDFLAAELGMPRKTLGTTSLRRGYATCLREHGVSQEFIRMLGYWRSDAGNDYDGAAMAIRLGCQKVSGPKRTSASSSDQLNAFKAPNATLAAPPTRVRETTSRPFGIASSSSPMYLSVHHPQHYRPDRR